MPLRLFVLAVVSAVIVAALAGCRAGAEAPDAPAADALFAELSPEATGVDFANTITPTEAFNVFTYRNFYNGGGVGIGDVNGDGHPDLYLTGNQVPNRLYLGRGDLRFEDVTEAAGVAGERAWSTGVAIVDVNGDGRLDLYVCNAGNLEGDDRANELFVNLGNGPDGTPRFEERAADYGIGDEGYSTHAAFFDYDRDGDLDLYVLNNSFRPVSSFGLRNIRGVRDARGGDKLYRNDGPAGGAPDGTPRFTDVSEAAGIYGSEIAFGLGVTVGDVDRDGWPDVYVSNDFFERDYLYLNNGDGTFREALPEAMPSISLSSMGADMADVTNDGLPEVYVTDMLPPSDARLKATSTFESWDVYRAKLRNDYHHQFMRNTLQRNNGDGTFSDVAQAAGVHATDWSWGALLADVDGDGWKDVFVSNGVARDVTDQDFIAFLADEVNAAALREGRRTHGYLALLEEIPSTPVPNHLFVNNRDGTFTDRAPAWGLGAPSFSNGAAYGDLDNDGDLDLVVNNVDAPASIYRNRAGERAEHRHLRVRLEGEAPNTGGLGAAVTVRTPAGEQYLELMPTRGFQSSVDPTLVFGLPGAETADVLVAWPDGRTEVRPGVRTDTTLVLRQRDAAPGGAEWQTGRPAAALVFRDVTEETGVAWAHREDAFVDFDREGLVPRMTSREGPAVAVGDVDADGLDDLFFGGAAGAPGVLYRARPGGGYAPHPVDAFAVDRDAEDTGAAFLDADADGHLDLYVASGGAEATGMDARLVDRLYLGDGRGGFTRADGLLPTTYGHSGAVAAADYDGDGDTDLFVGARVVPGRYGEAPRSRLLRNDGGRFADVTSRVAPDLAEAGMVTTATWADADGDGALDLVTAGEWMPITVWRNASGRLEALAAPGLERSHGWWNRLVPADLDGDGDTDFVAGNLGHNVRLRARDDAPATLHAHDFDGNGAFETILSFPNGDGTYPLPLRGDLVRQLPSLKKRFLKHADYAGRTVEDLFTPDELSGARVLHAYTFSSAVVENRGDGTFRLHALPFEAQIGPVYGVLPHDVDGDGHLDLVLAGGFHGFRPELGRMDASYGALLRGDGRLGFTAVPARASGLRIHGAVRDLRLVRDGAGRTLVVAPKNDAAVQVVEFRTPSVAS